MSDTFTVTTVSNRAPTLASIPNQAIDEGSEFNLIVSANDEDLPNDLIRFSLLSAPPGLVLSQVGESRTQLGRAR